MARGWKVALLLAGLGTLALGTGGCFSSRLTGSAGYGALGGLVVTVAQDPIQGALVTAQGRSALTDELGAFRLTGLAPGPAEVRIEADGFRGVTLPVQLSGGTDALPSVQLEVDGVMAWLERSSGQYRLRFSTGQCYEISPVGVYSLSLSPDGTRVAFTDTGGAKILEAATGQVELLPITGTGLAWSPDGGRLAYVVSFQDGRGRIHVYDLESGSPPGVDVGRDLPFMSQRAPSWSPDGRAIVFVAYQSGIGALYRVDLDPEGNPLRTSLLCSWNPAEKWFGEGRPAWSPDGEEIIFPLQVLGSPGDFDLYSVPAQPADPPAEPRLVVRRTKPSSGEFCPVWPARGE
ncbi:MAG: carboxypeptidase regulatory-like domain-containing protein, partial [Bacillota bacterium]|nr:carboxypeptidase regulatory-like domain-containing protein [Bacillota bacterium]